MLVIARGHHGKPLALRLDEDRIKPMANYIKGRLKERHGTLGPWDPGLWEGIFREGEGNARPIFLEISEPFQHPSRISCGFDR